MRYSYIITKKHQGQNLLNFLLGRITGLNEEKLQVLFYKKQIWVNGHFASQNYCISKADLVTLEWAKPNAIYSVEHELKIIFEDKDCLVVDKPAGVAVHPGLGDSAISLLHYVHYYFELTGQDLSYIRSAIVNRLDKDTSGVVVMAKNQSSKHWLTAQFNQRLVKKKYLGLVDGILNHCSGSIESYIARDPKNSFNIISSTINYGQWAKTDYQLQKKGKNVCLVEFRPLTGRTHQIRIHAQSIGNGLVGDRRYNINGLQVNEIPHHLLHAASLELVINEKGQSKIFESPLPYYFLDVLASY